MPLGAFARACRHQPASVIPSTLSRKVFKMHVVLLGFAENQAQAPRHMAGHKAWLEQGFADGVFLLPRSQ